MILSESVASNSLTYTDGLENSIAKTWYNTSDKDFKELFPNQKSTLVLPKLQLIVMEIQLQRKGKGNMLVWILKEQ